MALVVPAAASAGGWATVGLSPSKPPAGSGAGDRWVATLTVLQHGQTPLAGAKPVLILTDPQTGNRAEFAAKPTNEVGVYRVVAKLPAAGMWGVAVYDGFTAYGGAQTHTFAPITVGDGNAPVASPDERPVPAPAAAADDFQVALVVAGALAALLAAVGVVAFALRSRRKAAAAV